MVFMPYGTEFLQRRGERRRPYTRDLVCQLTHSGGVVEVTRQVVQKP